MSMPSPVTYRRRNDGEDTVHRAVYLHLLLAHFWRGGWPAVKIPCIVIQKRYPSETERRDMTVVAIARPSMSLLVA